MKKYSLILNSSFSLAPYLCLVSMLLLLNGCEKIKAAVAPGSLAGTQSVLILKHFASLTAENVMKPALILQKIIVNSGGLKPSYLGPPESYIKTLSADRQVLYPKIKIVS